MNQVKGHGFSRAINPAKSEEGFSPCMSKLSRSSNPGNATGRPRTFFTTAQTAGRRPLFQTERMANLFIEILRSLMRSQKITIHDFVVMPDHFHILMTLPGGMSVEKAVQLIKGSFSYRAKRELGFSGEIWQRGFSDIRVKDEDDLQTHRDYIALNPVKVGLANSPEDYRYGSVHLKKQKTAKALPT
jgi:REP-associated tyrosine transposase